MRGMRWLAAAAGIFAILVLGTTPDGRASSLQGTIAYSGFYSTAIRGTMHYAVYVPPDYATSGKRYPVVYFLHGLPANATTYRNVQQVAQAVEQSGHEAIVVSVQGARAGETDPEWLDAGPGHDWETATAVQLVSTIDNRYRTIAQRAGRLLIGISAGGYGATMIALHHPSTFAVVESWSGYFHATTPDGTAPLDLGSEEANDWANAHKLIPNVKRMLSLDAPKTYFAFYVGTNDSLFRTENEQFYAQLRKAGIYRVVFEIYKGAHDWSLWGAHDSQWLGAGLAVAAKPV